MDNYTTKLEVRENKEEIILPQVPFVVIHSTGENAYMVVKKYNVDDEYLVIGLSKGVAYDLDYTIDIIKHYIEDGTWILRESTIVLE